MLYPSVGEASAENVLFFVDVECRMVGDTDQCCFLVNGKILFDQVLVLLHMKLNTDFNLELGGKARNMYFMVHHLCLPELFLCLIS